ncbi:MAG: hypothetical protein ACRC7N_15710 [Clostridium sp.]
MRIYLVDNSITGHHKVYESTLNKIKNTGVLGKRYNFTELKVNPIKAYKERNMYISSINKEVKGAIVHFLYLDNLYKLIYSNFTNKSSNKYIGTLHWAPKNRIEFILLKRFCKNLECIVVHSHYLKEYLESKGIKNIRVVDYPSFLKNIKEKDEGSNIIISCLGGTRSDKGLDILRESFQYLNSECKKSVTFNICGIEQEIKYSTILETANKYRVNITHKNKFLTDEEYEEEVKISKIILLPYRKEFRGNSGPMTDGIMMDKYIVGPNYGNIGYLINKYDLGSTFEVENPISLASELNSLINRNIIKNHEYKKELTVEKFLEKYEELYNEIKGVI